jgi:hypothetical protein
MKISYPFLGDYKAIFLRRSYTYHLEIVRLLPLEYLTPSIRDYGVITPRRPSQSLEEFMIGL